MGRPSLTDFAVRSLAGNGSSRAEVFDGKLPGFAVRVSPSGAKSFVLFYRFQGRLRRMTLGRYPALSLADARKRARYAQNQAALGLDPEATTKSSAKIDFNQAALQFLDTYCAHHNRNSTRRQRQGVLRNNFQNKWGPRDVRDITKPDVLQILDGLVAAGKPSAANNALVIIRKFFNWCVERGLVAQSPCAGIKRPAKEAERARVLSEAELRSVWLGAQRMGHPFGHIVQLLILTGQRRGEVARLHRDQLNMSEQLWTMSPEVTKNGRGHVVPLSSAAVQVIGRVSSDYNQFLFSRGAARYGGFTKAKKALDRVATVENWTLHDLRRTVATNMARLGVSPHVVERILNHVSGTVSGVAGIYNRFGYLPEMRAALDLWAAHISSLHAEPVVSAKSDPLLV